ncbi:hypothetical protein D1Z98_00215 [Riemerella anatipestifer]|nr:hypothetical protein [Riemerella anatipestifer]
MLVLVLKVRAQDTLSIKLYAKNGDNSQTILSALNTKSNHPLKIIFTKGTYTIFKSLVTFRDNTKIIFEKGAKLKILRNDIYGLVVQHNRILIDNALFEGNGVSASDIHISSGIMIRGSKNVVVKNSRFYGISGIPIFISRSEKGQGVDDVKILNKPVVHYEMKKTRVVHLYRFIAKTIY